jgi:hypothetical protein
MSENCGVERKRSKTERLRLLRWAGGLAGVPLVAGAYQRVASRRALNNKRHLIVRTRVEPALLDDLVDLVRRVQGRAALEGDSLSVPLPDGVAEEAAYRELRALLQTWELSHPGVRAEILHAGPIRGRRDGRPLRRERLDAIKS